MGTSRGESVGGARSKYGAFHVAMHVHTVRELPPPLVQEMGKQDDVLVEVRWRGGLWRNKTQRMAPASCESMHDGARASRSARVDSTVERKLRLPDEDNADDISTRPFEVELRVRRRGRRKRKWLACGAPATIDIAALARMCSPLPIMPSSPRPGSPVPIVADSGAVSRRMELALGGGLYRILLDVSINIARTRPGLKAAAAVKVAVPPRPLPVTCFNWWGAKQQQQQQQQREDMSLFASNPLCDDDTTASTRKRIEDEVDGCVTVQDSPSVSSAPSPAQVVVDEASAMLVAAAPAVDDQSDSTVGYNLQSHPCNSVDDNLGGAEDEAEILNDKNNVHADVSVSGPAEPLAGEVIVNGVPEDGGLEKKKSSDGILKKLGGLCTREEQISPPPSHSLMVSSDGVAEKPAEIALLDEGAEKENDELARALALSEKSHASDAARRDALAREEEEQVSNAQMISKTLTVASRELDMAAHSSERESKHPSTSTPTQAPQEQSADLECPPSTGDTPLRVSKAALAQCLLAKPERLEDGWIRLVLPERERAIMSERKDGESDDHVSTSEEESTEWRWTVEARLGSFDQTSASVGGSGACACIAVAIAEAYASYGLRADSKADFSDPGGIGVPHSRGELDAVVAAGSRWWRGACQLEEVRVQHAQHGFHLDLESALEARRSLAKVIESSTAGDTLADDASSALRAMAEAPPPPAKQVDAASSTDPGEDETGKADGQTEEVGSPAVHGAEGRRGSTETAPLELPPGYDLAVDHAQSFVGFLPPPPETPLADFLAGAPDVRSMFRDAASACASTPRGACFIAGWNDHWFTVFFTQGGSTAYLVDTLGSRLFEGCSRSYCIRFPNKCPEETSLSSNGAADDDASFWRNEACDAAGARSLCAYLELHAARSVLAEVARGSTESSLEPDLRRLQMELRVLRCTG